MKLFVSDRKWWITDDAGATREISREEAAQIVGVPVMLQAELPPLPVGTLTVTGVEHRTGTITVK